jgi:hypothetical protein
MDHDHTHVDQHIADEFIHDHQEYLRIFLNNREFIRESLERDPEYFVKLSRG